MTTRIAVEPSMEDIKSALMNSGYEVVPMNEQTMNDCSCCVISGQDKNVMGIADRATRASIINAEGMTAQEVVDQVKRSASKVQ